VIDIRITVRDGVFDAVTRVYCDSCSRGMQWKATTGMRDVASPTFVEWYLREHGWSAAKYHTCPNCKAANKPKKRRRGRS
jgi:hypothetical protein